MTSTLSQPAASPDARQTTPLAERLGEQHIADVHRMAPFLMTVVSASDLWMYVSSAGGLTAGRRQAEQCLFPYETDDRLHRLGGQVGPLTLLRIEGDGAQPPTVWRPWLDPADGAGVRHTLTKSLLGHRVGFAAEHHAHGLSFAYDWTAADDLGWARHCVLTNTGDKTVRLTLLDGLRAVFPAGVDLRLQQSSSCLVNAYRRSQLSPNGLGLFYLETAPTDLAQPSESLRCNTVWHDGLPGARVTLSAQGLRDFELGGQPVQTVDLKGRVGSYLLQQTLTLEPGQSETWSIVGDVHRSQAQAVALDQFLADGDRAARLQQAKRVNAQGLLAKLAPVDALQQTGRSADAAQHLANVLFNTLRGGVPADQQHAPAEDVRSFLLQRQSSGKAAATLPAPDKHGRLDCASILKAAEASGDPDAIRLALEYLPITFGRRHGDPSRPWNIFTIRLTNADGSPRLDYQGNWRDIFQNWEAMALSFPRLLDRMIARFVNASTIDGFNPYRITRDGFDWEVLEADSPWANIGYWGDHQIIYLLKLLEWQHRFDPARLKQLMTQRVFATADVPYRLKTYADIVADPRATVLYDDPAEARLNQRVADMGADGQLRPADQGQVERLALAEKLLIPVLAKLSCFVPDGGIWMSTQRPEWNDANNALAGYGLSMVTLAYLRRHLAFLGDRFDDLGEQHVELSAQVGQWFDQVMAVFDVHAGLVADPAATIADADRRKVVDALGIAFERYREAVYDKPLGAPSAKAASELAAALRRVLPWLDHAIRHNLRDDGLYHGYNLIRIEPESDTASLDRLGPILEGQVAILSAGVLTPSEVCALVDAMFKSALFRDDQGSFLLYPNRELPNFLDKNRIPLADARAIPLLARLLDEADPTLIEIDAQGHARFHADFHHASDLVDALDALAAQPAWADAVAAGRQAVLDLYESVFHHHAFTGRSGGMYGFEGLGCIYWHMSSKLLLAVQENLDAARANADPGAADLADRYQQLREGTAATKSPEQYGAFPTDPYSHTPSHAGAQQPGMTGQVKEQILTRVAELGVSIEDGALRFDPAAIHEREYLSEPGEFAYLDLDDQEHTLPLPAGSYAMTLFQTPVVVQRGAGALRIEAHMADGATQAFDTGVLPADLSARLFNRDGAVRQLTIHAP
ncbi:MAG: hypothetical protein AAGA57_08690 [Planctomycetota bacterium]